MARTAWAANAIPVELTGKHHALTNDAAVAANGQSVHLLDLIVLCFPLFIIISNPSTRETGGKHGQSSLSRQLYS